MSATVALDAVTNDKQQHRSAAIKTTAHNGANSLPQNVHRLFPGQFVHAFSALMLLVERQEGQSVKN